MSIRDDRGLEPDLIVPAFNGVRQRCCALTGGDILVKQNFAQECDVNFIVAKYNQTGVLPGAVDVVPRYEDVSGVPSLFEAMEIVRRAHDSFNDQPADLRARFGNDPLRFVSFLDDPGNRDEAVRLGLLKAPSKPPSVDLDASDNGNVPLPK